LDGGASLLRICAFSVRRSFSRLRCEASGVVSRRLGRRQGFRALVATNFRSLGPDGLSVRVQGRETSIERGLTFSLESVVLAVERFDVAGLLERFQPRTASRNPRLRNVRPELDTVSQACP
jgi:hypothetical protein